MGNIKELLVHDVFIKGIIVVVVCGAITAYLNENLKILRTSFLVASAKRKIKTDNPEKIKRGVNILIQNAIDAPYRRQEMIDIIVNEFFRKNFQWRENPPVTNTEMVVLFVDTLNAILNLPRENENKHHLNLDLHQVALVAENGKSIYLQNMDFRDVVLWGSEFINVDFSRSNFENADLGGVLFVNCGMEDLNLKNAKMSYSFLDPKRPTTILKSLAARSNIDESLIISGTQAQLVISGTEIDLERREKLKGKSPMVQFDN